jgi:4-aminobutyrate aminotransferase-like enzyme
MYVASARGAVITNVESRDYIDFTGGIAVMNVGHSHPKAGVDHPRLRQSGQRHPDFDAAGILTNNSTKG